VHAEAAERAPRKSFASCSQLLPASARADELDVQPATRHSNAEAIDNTSDRMG
jgi:hypothetical protein